ncbi:unnamed protein product [Linum trigynum]
MIDSKYTPDMNEFVEDRKKLVDSDLWKDMQKTLAALLQATTIRDNLAPSGSHNSYIAPVQQSSSSEKDDIQLKDDAKDIIVAEGEIPLTPDAPDKEVEEGAVEKSGEAKVV